MSTRPVTIPAGERLSTVEDIMTLGGVRHMPVVQRGRLVGVVSERDLLRASLSALSGVGTEERRAFLSAVEISEVMSEPPITIGPEAKVEEAAHLMAEHKIGCLPVLEKDELVGMVTETDLLRYFAGLFE
jgi:acetoin utilization protein AcuB